MRNIFSFRSPSFRKLGRDVNSIGEVELISLIVSEPRFLRRPLMVDGERVIIGRDVGA